MDANGTRLFMILGKKDWSDCTDDEGVQFSRAMESGPKEYVESTVGLGWDEKRSEVILHPRLMKFKAAPRDIPPTVDDRRGSARDRYGNWYWIDPARTEILVNSSGTGTTSHFWSSADQISCFEEAVPGEFQAKERPPAVVPCTFGGLAVTEDHFLVVGVLKPAGLLVFDLHAGGLPGQILWPDSIVFEPFDMAPAPGGGVWILDRVNKRYWAIDRNMKVVNVEQPLGPLTSSSGEDFESEAGATEQRKPRLFPTGIPLPIPSPLDTYDPISIEALPDGTVLILDTNPHLGSSSVSRYEFSRQLGPRILLDEFEFAGHDIAFVPEHESDEGTVEDRLYVASTDGNQTYAFTISRDENQNLALGLIDEYYPMRLFGGKTLVSSGTTVYYDFGTGWIPLVRQLRPQYTVEGTLETPIRGERSLFDGRVPDCVWHRLMLDASIPADTEVNVSSRAANDLHQLSLAEWYEEPRLHRRADGSELPFVPSEAGKDAGTWELLFQNAVGRHLQLRLKFQGEGKSTPRVRGLRVYAPRFSYLNEYLPAVYREDKTSASFLDRFLANFEGTYTAIEDKIAAVQVLFDTRGAPAETLEWLAGWLGVSLDPAWDESRRRLFIKHAMTFFRLRGTVRGLQLALRLALDQCVDESIFDDEASQRAYAGRIRIVEKFRIRRHPGVIVGEPAGLSGPRTVPVQKRWQPSHGRDVLQREYRKRFKRPETEPLPVKPVEGIEREQWTEFMKEMLGFVPSATPGDCTLWQEFLARRYRQPSAMNDAYKSGKGKAIGSFAEAKIPERLPDEGAPLFDWYQFQSIVLPMHRSAHRFMVMIPLAEADTENLESQTEKLQLARRIIELEKPAHTVFDVKFYLDLFRVGMVRLGSDTLLGAGIRSPYFTPPAVLGRSYLLESFLAPRHPQNVSDRRILGRDRLET